MNQNHFNTIEASRKSGKHLTLDERGVIQALNQQGYSLRSIAAAVGCAHTTVYYEIRRGTPKPKSNRGRMPKYTARRGQKAYEEHRKNSKRPLKIYCDDCEPFIQWMVKQIRKQHRKWIHKNKRIRGRSIDERPVIADAGTEMGQHLQCSPKLRVWEPKCILHTHTVPGNALRMNDIMVC